MDAFDDNEDDRIDISEVSNREKKDEKMQGCLTFEKVGDNLLLPEAPETSKFRGTYSYRAANVSNFFGVHFCAKLYRNEGPNIDETYHKNMYDL